MDRKAGRQWTLGKRKHTGAGFTESSSRSLRGASIPFNNSIPPGVLPHPQHSHGDSDHRSLTGVSDETNCTAAVTRGALSLTRWGSVRVLGLVRQLVGSVEGERWSLVQAGPGKGRCSQDDRQHREFRMGQRQG